MAQTVQLAKVVGGIGEKKSNGGTQWYQQNRIYYGDIALCVPANLPGGSYMYVLPVKKLGNIYGATGGSYAGNVYDKNYCSPTINTGGGGNRQPMIIENAESKTEY